MKMDWYKENYPTGKAVYLSKKATKLFFHNLKAKEALSLKDRPYLFLFVGLRPSTLTQKRRWILTMQFSLHMAKRSLLIAGC